MKIVNELLIRSFGGPGICEVCLNKVRQRDCHHVFSRGAGRLDISANLISVCSVFSGGDNCHHLIHQGNIARDDLLKVIGDRDGIDWESIEDCIFALRRADKNASAEDIIQEYLRRLDDTT